MKKINVGIIGFGFIGEVHANHYCTDKYVNKICIAEVDPENLKKGKRYRATLYSDYREMLKKEDLNAVSICTPHDTHCEIAIEAARHKLHILLEKPIATSLGEADRIITNARENKVKLMVAHSLRFGGTFQKAHEILNKGTIGPPIFMVGKYWWFKDYTKYPPWKTKKSLAYGGTLIRDGIHILDLLLWYGKSEVKEVFGRRDKLLFKEYEVEDNFLGIIVFKNGVVAHYGASSVTKGFTEVGIDIYGPLGSIKVDTQRLKLYLEKYEGGEGAVIEPAISNLDFWGNQIHHFTECVVEDKEPLVTGEMARKSLEVTLKLYESAGENKVVAVS